ncbi:MAG: acyl-CoA thioesterase [Beijerinckiaceae bacterium]
MTETGGIITDVTLRYADMDANNHLNNAVYATLFEAGRVAYLSEVLSDVTPLGAGFVIVRLTIDFKAEARYPGMARILTRMERIGGSSMTYAQTISVNGKLVASAESICALFDLTRRKAMRCPEPMRARLRGLGATG